MLPLVNKLLARAGYVKASEANKERKKPTNGDPLDPIKKLTPFPEDSKQLRLLSVHDFPKYDALAGEGQYFITGTKAVGDAALDQAKKIVRGDRPLFVQDDAGMLKNGVDNSAYTVPAALQAWYQSQGFIGYQSCAIIAQHWLVDKSCSMSGEDAARNGWEVKARGGDDLDEEQSDTLKEADKEFKIKENLIELNRFKNVFGIRVCIFQIESDDPLYYEKPFNIDGVKEGSYIGISQVDPYWMMPVMTTKGTSDPANKDFYDPEYWVISGKKYHKSHLCIVRGPQPADILKPTYIFGGIPLVQRIYERVYAAERTANESPLLAMSKRTMAIHTDLERVAANQADFEERLALWIAYRDNHGVKVLGKEEVMEQFDINLSDFDSIIMNQYQLVAAIARVPSTKLLGTSPKGFNATGEFEMKSYHEELESVQEHVMMPLLTRHYDIMMRHLGFDTEVEVVCNPVDSLTAKERAELNDLKSQTGDRLINNGSISPDEERGRVREDEHSGYNRLTDVPAEEEPGASPENLASYQKAGAQLEKAAGEETLAGKGQSSAVEEAPVGGVAGATPGEAATALVPLLLGALTNTGNQSATGATPNATQALIAAALAYYVGNQGAEPEALENPIRGTKPGTQRSVQNGVGGVHETVGKAKDGITDWNPSKLPKMRLHGLNLVIENPRGSIRRGSNVDGQWSNKMAHHYGYIKGYGGADGDDVDCFIGPNLRAKDVFVIKQKDPTTGEFDEYKCMLGFDDESAALDAYIGSYSRDWDGLDGCQTMSLADFQSWLDSGACAKG